MGSQHIKETPSETPDEHNVNSCLCFNNKPIKENELIITTETKELKRVNSSRNSVMSKKSIKNTRNKFESFTLETLNALDTQPAFSYRKQSLYEVFS